MRNSDFAQKFAYFVHNYTEAPEVVRLGKPGYDAYVSARAKHDNKYLQEVNEFIKCYKEAVPSDSSLDQPKLIRNIVIYILNELKEKRREESTNLYPGSEYVYPSFHSTNFEEIFHSHHVQIVMQKIWMLVKYDGNQESRSGLSKAIEDACKRVANDNESFNDLKSRFAKKNAQLVRITDMVDRLRFEVDLIERYKNFTEKERAKLENEIKSARQRLAERGQVLQTTLFVKYDEAEKLVAKKTECAVLIDDMVSELVKTEDQERIRKELEKNRQDRALFHDSLVQKYNEIKQAVVAINEIITLIKRLDITIKQLKSIEEMSPEQREAEPIKKKENLAELSTWCAEEKRCLARFFTIRAPSLPAATLSPQNRPGP